MTMLTPQTSGRSRDPFERALVRYHSMQRASRWGVLAGIALGGFFLLDSVLWPIADVEAWCVPGRDLDQGLVQPPLPWA